MKLATIEAITSSARPSSSTTTEEVDGFYCFKQASIANFSFALWLKEQQESMKPKDFSKLLQREGMVRREANKFLKLAENAKGFTPEDLAYLGPMMFSLISPRFIPLWKALQDEGTLTQDVVDALKKELFPRKKASIAEPDSIWRQQQGGGKRYAQLPPIHNQETGTKFQHIMETEGITAQKAFDKVVANYTDGSYPKAFETDQESATLPQSSLSLSIARSPEDSSPNTEVAPLLVFTATPETHLDTPLPCSASENPTEQDIAQAEFNKYVEIQAQSVALEPHLDALPLPYIKEVAIAPEESSSAAAIPTSSPALPVAVDEQAIAHAKLSIDEQLIASTAAPNILANSDTPSEETDEIPSSIDTVSESQKETPANEQAIAQAELNKYMEEQGEAIAPEVTTPSQATTTQSDRESTTAVLKETIPQGGVVADLPSIEPDLEFQAQLDTPLPCPAVENLTEQEVAQAGLNAYEEAQAQEIAPFVQNSVPHPSSSLPHHSVAPPEVGGELDLIDEASSTTVTGDTQGIDTSSVEETSPPLPSLSLPAAMQQILYRVGETGNDWQGEIVQLVAAGPVYHEVRRLDNDTWTQIQRKFLQEISLEEGVAVQTALSKEIATDHSLRLGDAVQWDVAGLTLTGTLVRLTKLGAFIDEGVPGHAWIKYPLLKKIELESAPPKSLREILKVAQNWNDIEREVGRDRLALDSLLDGSSHDDVLAIHKHLIEHLERDQGKALKMHDIDWVPFYYLKDVFKNLSFEIKDISEGLAPNWISGCTFRSVTEFGKGDREVWEFATPLDKTIHAWDRADIRITAF